MIFNKVFFLAFREFPFETFFAHELSLSAEPVYKSRSKRGIDINTEAHASSMIEELKVPAWTEHDYREALRFFKWNPPELPEEEDEEKIEAETAKLREKLEEIGLSDDIPKLLENGVRSRHKLATLNLVDIEVLGLKGTMEQYESLYVPALDECELESSEIDAYGTFTHEYLVRRLEKAKRWRDRRDERERVKEMEKEAEKEVRKKQKLEQHEEIVEL